MSESFRVGVNYWPAASAMRWWRRFDAGEVDADFARIREAGGDCVRFFLLWEDFQPAADAVSESALASLVTVADTARRHGLAIIPTLFTGHMSGANWIPQWALGPTATGARFRVVADGRVRAAAIRNWYADAEILGAQALLAREAAGALAGHPALWAWDLGNENSNCCVPPRREDGWRWLDRVAEAIVKADPSVRITAGLHMEDLEEDRRLGPADAARVCDFLCMHGYPIYAPFAHRLDPGLVAFLSELTGWLGGKDVLFAELGAPTRDATDPEVERIAGDRLLSETEAAEYTARAFERLSDAGALGALVWCYSDYVREIWPDDGRWFATLAAAHHTVSNSSCTASA